MISYEDIGFEVVIENPRSCKLHVAYNGISVSAPAPIGGEVRKSAVVRALRALLAVLEEAE